MSYIQQLLECKVEARLVVSGALSLHELHGLLESPLISHVGLDEMLEAGHHRLCLFAELPKTPLHTPSG